jgi:hypothetical protein
MKSALNWTLMKGTIAMAFRSNMILPLLGLLLSLCERIEGGIVM